MDARETSVFRRPPFDPRGQLVARRELRFGDVVYAPTTSLPPPRKLGLDARMVRVLWEQFAIDTVPRGKPEK